MQNLQNLEPTDISTLTVPMLFIWKMLLRLQDNVLRFRTQLLTPFIHQNFANQIHLQSLFSANCKEVYSWRTFFTENSQEIKTGLNFSRLLVAQHETEPIPLTAEFEQDKCQFELAEDANASVVINITLEVHYEMKVKVKTFVIFLKLDYN